MSAPWYLEKGQREIVAGRRFEGDAPLNIAGIRGKAERRAGGVRAAGDEQRGRPSAPPITPTARAEDAPSKASGLTGRSLSRVSEIRTGSAGSGSIAQRRSVKRVGKPRPNAVSGSVCASSDSAVSVCSVPVYGCVKRNASPGARTVKRGPGSGAGVRRRESSIEWMAAGLRPFHGNHARVTTQPNAPLR